MADSSKVRKYLPVLPLFGRVIGVLDVSFERDAYAYLIARPTPTPEPDN